MTKLTNDANGNAVQALGLRDDGAQKITIGATSARNPSAFNTATKIIWIYADTDTYIKLGGDDVTATSDDHFIPAGIRIPLPLNNKTRIAAVQSTASGTLYISEGA